MSNLIHSIDALHTLQTPWRQKNERIALVPTMGNLHEGHLALVKLAQQVADRVVVSIFVNPLQFGPNEDFLRYPRTMEADSAKLASFNVDAVFVPDMNEIYPNGEMPLTRVIVPGLSDDLCGITRPQLFYGVTTVVSKLFHITQPNIAIFGEKDFQQLVIIRQMVRDLNFPIKILSGATVRELDGLALSSRNQYLDARERQIAPKLYATLREIEKQLHASEKSHTQLTEAAVDHLLSEGFNKVDYVAIRDKQTLGTPIPGKNELIVLAAAFLGNTRLIDNLAINPALSH